MRPRVFIILLGKKEKYFIFFKLDTYFIEKFVEVD